MSDVIADRTTQADVSRELLKQRLGRYALGASRDVEAVAELAVGENIAAVAIAVWQRRGWVVVATDAGLRLARRPRLFGRARRVTFEWDELSAVSSGPQRVALTFGDTEVSLVASGPHDEFVRLIEAARGRLGAGEKPSVEDLRALAKLKLGRVLAFGFEASIDGLPDRLDAGERVERLAGATGEFAGLLVLTDRRLLLLDVTLRRANERLWDLDRSAIRSAERVAEGLRLIQRDDETTLTDFVPPERRDEFAAVLTAGRE